MICRVIWHRSIHLQHFRRIMDRTGSLNRRIRCTGISGVRAVREPPLPGPSQ
jgi:hypothetical protein